MIVDTPFIKTINYQLSFLHPLFSFSIYFLILVIVAFFMFNLNEKYSFIRTRTILPSLFFLFLVFISELSINNSGLVICLLLLPILSPMLSAYQENEPVKKVFNSFFFISIGSFFLFDLLFLVPVFWISFSLLRISGIRTFLSSIIGLTAPYVIILPIIFSLGHGEYFIESINKQEVFRFSIPEMSTPQILYTLFLFVLFLIHFFYFRIQINFDKIRTRGYISFFQLITVAFALLIVFKFENFMNLYFPFIMMMSFLLGHYFSLKNARFTTFLFYAFIIINLLFLFFR